MRWTGSNVEAIPAIEVIGLTCSYQDYKVLEGVSFKVLEGEIFFIIGAVDVGKTTLLRNMVGLEIPVQGEVRFNGRSFTRADSSERYEMLKTFGLSFQGGGLWTSLTLRENLALPLKEYTQLPPDEIGRIADFKLSQVGLAGFENYYPSEISGGMKKRAGIARALALDPVIVFFDAPSAGLDPITARGLDRLILQIRDTFGTTMVIASHDIDSIVGIADRLILLDAEARGIIAEGSPSALIAGASNPKVLEFLTRRTVRST